MLDIDLVFPHSYEIEDLPELSGTGKSDLPVIYFPQPKTRLENDGLWLKVRAETGEPWIGVFAFGYSSPPAFSRVISSPDRTRACIISKGRAFIVKADEPASWEEIPVMPVLDVRMIQEYQLLVFSDFIRLAAYGSSGLI